MPVIIVQSFVLGVIAFVLGAWSPVAVVAQSGAATQPPPLAKLPLAIGAVKITPSLAVTLTQRGQLVELGRVQEAMDPQLINAFQATRKFELVSRSDLKDVVLEQDFSGSGNVDKADPNAAKAFKLAGAKYVVVSTIDDFQDTVQEAEFKEIGKKATRRQVRLSVIAKVYDTTNGKLLESINLQMDNSAFVRNPEFLIGEKGSNLTEKALQEMARQMAEKIATRVADVLMPAKIIAMRDASVAVNRGDGSGIAVGQTWRVFALGAAMMDPDTGENLGNEEVPVGAVRITSVLPKTAMGEVCGDNRGIAMGCILRQASDACTAPSGSNVRPPVPPVPPTPPTPPIPGAGEKHPPAVSPGAVRELTTQQQPPALPPLPSATGSARTTTTNQPAQSTAPSTPVSTVTTSSQSSSDAANVSQTAAASAASANRRPVAAIFVKNRGNEIAADKVMVMEDFVVAKVGELCFTTLSREDVINAVRKFAAAGANVGTMQDPNLEADRLLSDQTSAVALARSMNADYVLVVSLSTLSSQEQQFEGYGVKTSTISQTLDATYRLLDRAAGSVIDSGSASATEQVRSTPNLQQKIDLIDPLLKQVAARLITVMEHRCQARALTAPAALDGAAFSVNCTMLDIAVPNVVLDANSNRYTVAANPLSVSPMGVAVEVDGVVVGSTPGQFRAPPGLHKLRLRAPGFKPWEGTVNISDGFTLQVALQMESETYARWLITTKVLQDLKQGQQLTDAQVDLVRGVAAFFTNSRYVVDYKVDTKQAPPLIVPSVWGGAVIPAAGP